MKNLAAVLCVFLVAGCEHYVDLKASDFEPGDKPRTEFLADNANCQGKAEDLRDKSSGNGDPHGLYNRAYRACMRQLGYRSTTPEGFDGW